MWIAIAGYLCSFLGAFQVPVFLLVMGYVLVSTAYHLQTSDDHDASSYMERLQKLFNKNDFEKSLSNLSICRRAAGEPTLQSDVEDISLSDTIDSEDTFDAKLAEEPEVHQSDTYFKLLFYACLGTFLYRNIWMFILAAVPVFLHLLYTAGSYTGLTQFVCGKLDDAYRGVRVNALELVNSVCLYSTIYSSAVLGLGASFGCAAAVPAGRSGAQLQDQLYCAGFAEVICGVCHIHSNDHTHAAHHHLSECFLLR